MAQPEVQETKPRFDCVKCAAALSHPSVRACPACGWLWPARRSPPRHIKQKVIARQDGRCGHCGSDSEPLTIHHITPLAEGGTHKMGNLEALCSACHGAVHG